jgi:hypothetical protein
MWEIPQPQEEGNRAMNKKNSSNCLNQNDDQPIETSSDRSVKGVVQPTPINGSDLVEFKSEDRKPSASSSETVYRAKQRLLKARKSGPDRPLGQLVKAEADLENRSQALQALSASKQKMPDKDLLIYQVTHAINTSRASRTVAPLIKRDTMLLVSAMDSSDTIEAILDRHIVVMSNSAMECHARAAHTSNLKALDVSFRHAAKITRVLIDLIEARERRRRPKQVVVGNVNVEAGGQAIVGTVEAPKPRPQSDDEPNDESTAA